MILAMRLHLGAPTRCSDGDDPHELADVVIDPSQRRVTHLVVQPRDRPDLARLVPIAMAHSGGEAGSEIHLDCTVAELEQLEGVHGAAYMRMGEQPRAEGDWEVGIEEISPVPSGGGFGPGGIDAGIGPTDYDPHVVASYDRVPKGEVEIRRRSAVTSSQGDHLGHVDGFVIDDEHRITEFVLQHGHLWGKREILIPSSAVAGIENDEVLLTLSKHEVGH